MKEKEYLVRARLVKGMLAFTQGTPAQASAYERRLLAYYVRGELSLQQIEHLLTTSARNKGAAG